MSELREFTFDHADFERIREMLYAHAGIKLTESKKNLVYSRLSRRLRATGHHRFKDYLFYLENGDDSEWSAFVNALTTNLTSFFREPHHFPILAEHLSNLKNRPLRVWTSAASTGEEAYTIAMTVVDRFRSFKPPVEIIATDIDTSVLAKAEAGIYPLEHLEKLDSDLVKRFFLRGAGRWDGYGKVREELRRLVSFRHLNLQDSKWPVSGPFDAIFCRNVMIYFDKNTQYKILKRFVPLFQPHGLLFAGHSESLHHAADLFKLRGKTVYELAPEYRNRPRSTTG